MARQRESPLRLNIPSSLAMQQPMQQAMFSPALPTSLQQSFHPPYPIHNSLQTPMQPYFSPPVPSAPGRPIHHHNQASIAHLAAAGIHPPNGFMTPVTGHFSRPSLMLGPSQQFPHQHPSGPPYPNRHRKQLSIGGPPKAVLGGPARKFSPLPPSSAALPPPVAPKVKKVTVNLPPETVKGEEGQSSTRPSWSRDVLSDGFVFAEQEVQPVETTTSNAYPPDEWRLYIPGTLDVFLPGKQQWDTIKQKAIEEKLERLGVERGSGSNVPHIHAPHARAASISSPADPALLLFKLNKLQQSQQASSASNSLTTSPQPPFGSGLTPSPQQPPRFLTNRHGHSMSLAQPPTYQTAYLDPSAPAFNTYGLNTIVPARPISDSHSPSSGPSDGIYAPQGRIPVKISSLAPLPLSASRPTSRPDFTRGFGLDIPEEEEPEDEEIKEALKHSEINEIGESDAENDDLSRDMELDSGVVPQAGDEAGIVAHNQHHSRDVSNLSRLSAVLSLVHSTTDDAIEREQAGRLQVAEDVDVEDAVGEWTGSEDLDITTEVSDDESIGEWSNPSDEERARHQRMERRIRRRATQQMDKPRRLPNFPRPPENMIHLPPREDDIVSNPSGEGRNLGNQGEYLGVSIGDYYSRPPSGLSQKSNRPLSPVPHSRESGEYSAHDPAKAHSRSPSESFVYPGSGHGSSQPSLSLNPFAKPFVFSAPIHFSGPRHSIGGGTSTPPTAPVLAHSHKPSIGKPLNVAAPEFKPLGFTFRPPAGVPQMPSTSPELSRSSPAFANEGSPYKVQGREKRQRRGSTESIEEDDTMSSFKFPPDLDSPKSIRRKTSFPSLHRNLNPSAEPFTFAGFSAVANSMPHVPNESDAPEEATAGVADDLKVDNTANVEDREVEADRDTMPSTTKTKRAPVPLDFKHPVSSNTVPAGLFKALVNGGDDRTRRTVRSRLSSREIFEHVERPSMDDLNVPPISHQGSRGRLITAPEMQSVEDVFGVMTRQPMRRPSLPAFRDTDHISSSSSSLSVTPHDLTARMEMHHLESLLGDLLDDKLSALRQDLMRRETSGGQSLNPAIEEMISDAVSVFRTQLQDTASRSLEDSHIDTRGEINLQSIKGIIEDGHKEVLTVLRTEVQPLAQGLTLGEPTRSSALELVPVIEQVANRSVDAIVEAISELSVRQEAVDHVTPARDLDAYRDMLMAALTPALASIRSEPIDYEFLTNQLTQAVKPHISQLIDLASDKRETASLIINQLLPLLPNAKSSSLDAEELTLRLASEVRRAIAPIDAFEIKEQVADLVVERLDSRLAVRDKAFNVDSVTASVGEYVTSLLQPMVDVPTAITQLVESHQSLGSRNLELFEGQTHISSTLSGLSSMLVAQLETVGANQADLVARLEEPLKTNSMETNRNLLEIKAVIEQLSTAHEKLIHNDEEAIKLHKEMLEKVNAFPESLSDVNGMLKNTLIDLFTSYQTSTQESEELRKMNTELQIQVTKARAAHGQIRVEKDVLNEKLILVEGELDRTKAQFKDLQTYVETNNAEASNLEARNAELEEALAKALARLQSSDVTAQASQKQIADLEKVNSEISAEKQALKLKADSLELQLNFAKRDKESATEALNVLQKQFESLQSQQTHWDDLRQASEKIDMLTTLIGQADNDELKELRRYRDHSKVLEGEHSALQKRYKDLENKMQNSDRAATTARQSLAQAQQRSSEWEHRANEYEGQLELTNTKLEQAEQTQVQLDADYSMIKLQLEEREADERLAKDRENRLREQVSALEAKASHLQNELEKALHGIKSTVIPGRPSPYRNITNGNNHPRPNSRVSVADNRSVTPNRHISSSTTDGSATPPQPSVWDSIHAPKNVGAGTSIHAPKGRYPNLGPTIPKMHRMPYQQQRHTNPSPTPSTVSLAPTLGEDGWYN